MVKSPPVSAKMQLRSLRGEDPLEEDMAARSSLAWKFPWTEEPGGP